CERFRIPSQRRCSSPSRRSSYHRSCRRSVTRNQGLEGDPSYTSEGRVRNSARRNIPAYDLERIQSARGLVREPWTSTDLFPILCESGFSQPLYLAWSGSLSGRLVVSTTWLPLWARRLLERLLWPSVGMHRASSTSRSRFS